MLTAAVFTLMALVVAATAQGQPAPAQAKSPPAQGKPKAAEQAEPAPAPPLAEVAKKELERRKGVKVPSRVFTDKDVRALLAKRPLPDAQAGAAPPAAAEPAESQTPSDAAAAKLEAEKNEAWWRERVRRVREEIRRSEMFAEALQSRINALATDFSSRDDPFQRLRIAEDRQKALAELERVRQELETLKTQLADIEEEARLAGVPPGWIR